MHVWYYSIMRCSVLQQCVAVCCNGPVCACDETHVCHDSLMCCSALLQCVAVYCSVLQWTCLRMRLDTCLLWHTQWLQGVAAVCCNLMQCFVMDLFVHEIRRMSATTRAFTCEMKYLCAMTQCYVPWLMCAMTHLHVRLDACLPWFTHVRVRWNARVPTLIHMCHDLCVPWLIYMCD